MAHGPTPPACHHPQAGWRPSTRTLPTCRDAFASSRLAPLDNIRFVDELTETPAVLALGRPELEAMRGEVARVAAERPCWTNSQDWQAKVVDRALIALEQPRSHATKPRSGSRRALRVVREHLSAGSREPPASTMHITEIVFLSHPFAWEEEARSRPADQPAASWGGFDESQLIAMEREVSGLWADAVRGLGCDTCLVINWMPGLIDDGPSAELRAVAREHLGQRLIELPAVKPTNAVGEEIGRLMRKHGLQFDAATVRAVAWGQSTEGCVQWFASHFAAGLGLPRGFRLDYPRTFPDANFAMVGRFVESLSATDPPPPPSTSPSTARRDCMAHMFVSQAGQPFALIVPGVMHDAEPARKLLLRGPAGSLSFTTKANEPVEVEATPTDEFTQDGVRLFDFGLHLPNHTMTANKQEIDGAIPWNEVLYVWGRADYAALRAIVEATLEGQP